MTRRSRRKAATPARPAPRPRATPIALHAPPGLSPALARLLSRIAIGVGALLAVAWLAVILGPHKIGDILTEGDFYGGYADGARLIQHGKLLPSRYTVVGPVYEVALAAVGRIVPDLFLGARLLSVASALAALFLWFRMLRRRADARLALIAALFLAVNPFFFRYGYAATTDALAFALQSAALYLLLASRGLRATLGAGMLAAFAFLTRYNAIYLLPAGLIAILGGGTLEDSAPPAGAVDASAKARRHHGRAALLVLAGFAAPNVPWVLYSLAHGGSFAFQLHHNIAYEVYARSRHIPWDNYQRDLQPRFKNLWDVIAYDPPAFFSRILYNLWDHLRLDARNLIGWPTTICAALGVGLAWWDGTLKRLWPILVAAGLLFLTLVPVFYSERYTLPELPAYAALAAAAFASPRLALAIGVSRRVWLKPALALIPLVLTGMACVGYQKRLFTQLPVEILECAKTLRELKRPGDRVIARKGHLGYYAGVPTDGFPFADSLPQLAAAARAGGDRWLYLSWIEAELRPAFWYLLDTSAVVPGLTPRRVTRPNPAVLYEIGPGFGQVPAWQRDRATLAVHNAVARTLVDSTEAKALLVLAADARNRDDPQRSRLLLERLLRKHPDEVDALILLGDVSLQLGDLDGGADAFMRAGSIDPSSVDARIGLGLATLMAGRQQEAAALWRPVISKTENVPALEMMAKLFNTVGDAAAEAETMARLAQLKGRG